MKIIVQEGAFTHTYDTSVNDKIDGGFLEEYFPPVEEAIDAALTLLWNVYDKRKIARAVKQGDIPALEYDVLGDDEDDDDEEDED